MGRGRGKPGVTGLTRWLLPASVLHGALGLLALATVTSRSAEPRRSHVDVEGAVTPAEAPLELTLLVDEERAPRSADPRLADPPASVVLDTSQTPALGITPSISPLRASTSARRASSSVASTAPSPPTEAFDAAEPAATSSSATGSSSASERPSDPDTAPALSLDQLGIGSTNPFANTPLARAATPAPLSPSEQANQRLQASLHQQWFDGDLQRGLGPEGPVVEAARRLLVADDGLIESNAVFNIRVDAGGHVTDVHVLEASSQVKAWQLIASHLLKDVGPLALRAPGTNQGWGLKLRLASALKLPSGRAPGLRSDILGVPLPGSAAPGATSLSLAPTSPLKMPEPIDPVGRHLDLVMLVELGLLKLDADVSDLAGSARRVVQVAVLSVDDGAAR